MAKLLVIEDSDKARQRLRAGFEHGGHQVQFASGRSFAEGASTDYAADLIVCDEKLPDSSGKRVIKHLRAIPSSKQIPVLLLIGSSSRSEQLHDALEAGANDAVHRNAPASEMNARVARLLTSRGEGNGAATHANTVTIVSARGGSGKTFLACNLAVAISQLRGETVALLDLNLEFGTTATLLNLEPKITLSEIARASVSESSDEAFDSMLLHHASGVRLLPALARPGDSELLKDQELTDIVQRLRRSYDHVIIDGRPSYREFMIDLWDHSDTLLVPCPADVPSVGVTRALLGAFNRVGVDLGRLLVVVNHIQAKSRLTDSQIEKNLSLPAFSIPYGGENLHESVNMGRPYVLSHPEEPAARAIRGLADRLLERYANRRPAEKAPAAT